jgi:hypothetical protein
LNVPKLVLFLSNINEKDQLQPLLNFTMNNVLVFIDIKKENTKDIKVSLENFSLKNLVQKDEVYEFVVGRAAVSDNLSASSRGVIKGSEGI